MQKWITNSRVRLVFYCLAWSIAHCAWGHSAFHWVDTQPLTLATRNAILHGYRFLNDKGEPNTGPKILLTHGLNSNVHEFEALLPALLAQGYDCYAFNFRGHGNGAERSFVVHYEDGDYGFEPMVEEDFPEMVRYVRGSDSAPITVIGHSMGGMVPRASLIRKTVKSSAIRSLVLIGSPAHFENQSLPGIWGWDKVAEMFVTRGRGDGSFDILSMVTQIDRLASRLPGYKRIQSLLAPIHNWFVRGMVVNDNFADHEKWLPEAITNSTPKDIYRSFLRWRKEGYPYRDQPIAIPVLHILGDADQLVPWEDVAASTEIQSALAGFWLIRLSDVSHLDLVSSKSVRTYESKLLDFVKSPKRTLKRKHRCHEILVAA